MKDYIHSFRTPIGTLIVLCSALLLSAAAQAGSVLSAGDLHVCGIQDDLSLICWGDNAEGQTSPPTGQFHQVSAGAYFNCALNTDGGIQCWGKDTAGETSPPPGSYVEVATGNNHACARKDNNEVICWGANEASQSAYLPGQFIQLALGSSHSCGLRSDGPIECWGSNSHGQAEPGSDNAYQYIAAGFDTTCGVNADGQASCWGREADTYGFLSQVDFALQGQTHQGEASVTCGIRVDGSLSCPTLTPPSGDFVYVTAGGHDGWDCYAKCSTYPIHDYFFHPFACGVRENGVVACWGDNTSNRATAPVGVVMATPPPLLTRRWTRWVSTTPAASTSTTTVP